MNTAISTVFGRQNYNEFEGTVLLHNCSLDICLEYNSDECVKHKHPMSNNSRDNSSDCMGKDCL